MDADSELQQQQQLGHHQIDGWQLEQQQLHQLETLSMRSVGT